MKTVVVYIMLLTLVSIMGASQTIPVSSSEPGLNLTNNTNNGFDIHYAVGQLHFQEITTFSGVFNELTISDYTSTNMVGLPKLPLLRKLISVPMGAQVNVIVTNTKTKTYSLDDYQIHYPIMPFQPSLSKSQKPEDILFEYDTSTYKDDRFTDIPTVQMTELGFMRGVRLFALDFVPVQYNPVTKKINVVSEADIRVDFIGADMAATEALLARASSTAFEPLYRKTVLNYISDNRLTLNRYPLGYLILTPAAFQATLQPFINWKIRQGYRVTVAIVGTGAGTIGNTTTAIKTYIQGVWDTATTVNPAPSYCLLVGDTPQITANIGTTDPGHVTDLYYFRLQGTDYMPEMYYGRFSATTVAELQPQVDKSLQYEQFVMPDPNYLQEVVMIGGVDASHGYTHANGQINYGTNNYFNVMHNIISHTYLYPTSGSCESQILANLNSGIGYINYTAHGSETYWADPYLDISNIYNLTNLNKYFVAIGNCCLTNHFDTSLCFGEAMLRAASKGAVAYVGGTNTTYWDEDYWWAVGHKPIDENGTPWIAGHSGVYDLLFHEHQEVFTDWVYGMGPMVFSGNLAVAQANSSWTNYYWEIYSIMGDPSLQPYMGLPESNTVELPSVIHLGSNAVQIYAEPYSYVAVSMNNVLYGAGLIDQTGFIDLAIEPFTAPGNAQIVVTRSNRRPMIQAIQVIPLAGPYLMVDSLIVSDSNNNQAEAGETFDVDLVLDNIGSGTAQNVTATISTTDSYVILNSTSSSIVSIDANSSLTISQAFNITVLGSTPDQHVVPFTITLTDQASSTWVSHINMTVSAPSIQLGTPVIQEVTGNGNGAFDPSETVQFSIPIANSGHVNTAAIHAAIVSNNPFLTISNGITNIAEGLEVDESSTLTCSIAISSSATIGTLLPVGISIHAGNIDHAITSYMQIGLFGDGFESGDLTALPWTMSGNANWTVVPGAGIPHTGTYCLKSGAIGNSQTTTAQVTMNIANPGNVSFWRKVSSESGFDKLFFYIDGTAQENWSGILSWGQASYAVTQGTHVFKWSYIKDNSSIEGSDCAWIDDIAFPLAGISSAPMFFCETASIDFGSIAVDSTASKTFQVQNLGTQSLTGLVALPNPYSLMIDDQVTNSFSIESCALGVFALTLHPTSPGTINDVLSITTNDPFMPIFDIILTGLVPVGNDDQNVAPIKTELKGNYPNPFNPSTYIAFSLKQTEHVSLVIYNVKGQLVKTLVSGKLEAGDHRILWEGKDNWNHQVSTGMYLCCFQAGNVNSTKKMMLLNKIRQGEIKQSLPLLVR
jgi:hypothetical protein